MDITELMLGRRTYRRFLQKPVPQDVIDNIIDAARLSSAGSNRQATSLLIVRKPADVARVNALVKWAAFLPPEQGTPKEGETPTLFVAVLQDTSIPGDLNTDTGIALANMTMAAWAGGVGSCIMGAINRPKLSEMFALPKNIALHTVIAFGYPSHAARVVPIGDGSNKYYLDENRDYCVPKRSREQIARYF